MVKSRFQSFVTKELVRARTKHPTPQSTLHEGHGVLQEEVDEVWDLVKSQRPNKDDLLKELIHVAAMAQRFAEDQLLTPLDEEDEDTDDDEEVEDDEFEQESDDDTVPLPPFREAPTFVEQADGATFCACTTCRALR
jgi:NTP pyrophosphatase (non-canonical NTP hydrolase)